MTRRQRTLCRQGTACLVVVLTLAACGPSPEDLVEQLTSGTGDVQMVRQELMLRRAQAVAPLLRALSYTEEGTGRTQIVSVLVSLSARLDDARIPPVLAQCLVEDSEPSVRSLVARLAGLHRRVDLAPALLAALEDSVADVRYEAAVALHAIGDRLTSEQELRLESRTHELAADPDPRVRLEGQARLERTVNRLGTDAKRKLLEGDSAAAESLYVQAIGHHPGTKRGHYRLARFYYDGGQTTRGLAYLHEQGMLLDVPHLAAAPNMDGLVDDEVWQTAARTDSFFSFSMEHTATPPCSERTRVLIGYTDEALYIAFQGHDANIAGLVAETNSADAERASGRGGLPAVGTIFRDDAVEMFVDADFDHKIYAHMIVNSEALLVDKWGSRSGGNVWDRNWRANAKVATHIGSDFWSLEYELLFDPERFVHPSPGTLWGFNVVRVVHGQEYCQWVRTEDSGHKPDEFGFLRFR